MSGMTVVWKMKNIPFIMLSAEGQKEKRRLRAGRRLCFVERAARGEASSVMGYQIFMPNISVDPSKMP